MFFAKRPENPVFAGLTPQDGSCDTESMTTVSVIEAGRDFAGTLRRMEAGHEAVIVKRGRKAVAVMVLPEMLAALEDLEDIREADKALAEYRQNPAVYAEPAVFHERPA